MAQQAVTQAQALRAQVSGVSLDEEAIRVMELQRGYQSMSKMISVINGLADTLMQMVSARKEKSTCCKASIQSRAEIPG